MKKEDNKKTEGASNSSVKEKKDQIALERQEEIKSYEKELVKFLGDRNIDLTATITVGQGGNQVQIHIIDKL
jgi:hypothetical protein